jgi:hypothetical protein
MQLARRPLVLAAVATAIMGVPATHAAGAVRSRTLQVSDLQRRAVEVRLERVGEHGPRIGEVGLLVRSRVARRGRLQIRYTSAYATPRFVVTAVARSSRGRVQGSLSHGRGLVAPVRPHDVLDLGMTFTARGQATPEDARGRLVIAYERGRRAVGAPLVLSVRGARAEERFVTVSPKAVSLPVTFYRPRFSQDPGVQHQDHGEAFVDLRGPGAAALARRGGAIDAVLRRDDGLSVVVPVKLKTRRRADNVTQLVIPGGRTRFDEPGRYSGRLPLGPGRSAPVVELVANVRIWWGWAVLAVLVGVLLGHMVPPLLRLERIRRRGRDTVADAIRRFALARRRHPEPASYDLDSLITPLRWQARGILATPHDEAARLLRELRDGQTPTELNRTVEAAAALRGRVERWAQIETCARELLDLLDPLPPPRGRGLHFTDTPPYADAYQVLTRLHTEPHVADVSTPTEDELRAVTGLCLLARREAKLIKLAREVWACHARLDGDERGPRLPEADEAERDDWELQPLWEGAGKPATRSAARFSTLAVNLRRAISHLAELERKYLVSVVPPSTLRERIGAALTRARFGAWRAIAALARGVIAAAEWLLRRAADLARALGSWLRGWLAVAELLSGLLKLSVPVLVYVLTLYGDTWGSPLDFLSAFAVGFAGKVGLDLGAAGISLRTGGSPPPPARTNSPDGAGSDQETQQPAAA